jgi:DNA replication protein DnaC
VEALMRQLKTPYARALAPELLITARTQRWEPAEVIKALLVEEVTGRARSMLATRRKAAGFPTGKTFDTWDPTASSIPLPTQQAFRTLEWIHRKENVVVCGPSGTGKTFFLEALGQQVVEAGMRVAWFRLEDLGALMRAHRSDDSVTRVVTRILRADLIVIDDIGLLAVGTDAAEGLYCLVDVAYEKRSIAISSNLHPAGFDELMPKTLATATVDRLLHHAHVCQTSGDSLRLTQALAGKGVIPMS